MLPFLLHLLIFLQTLKRISKANIAFIKSSAIGAELFLYKENPRIVRGFRNRLLPMWY